MGDKSTYFSNFMYRLILHGESHYQTQIHSMRNDLDFLDYISETEKQRTARDLLCMLYILNPLHIKIYIEENKKIDQIKQWLKAIKTDSEFELDTKDSCPKKIIKLYDYALSAGKGNDLMDDQVPHEDIEVNNMAADFAIKVSGDSMEELRFSPAILNKSERAKNKNPKRLQREIRNSLHNIGIGTKAQQALKLQHEQFKKERKIKSKEIKEVEKERQYVLRQEKKKEKHKGR